MNLLSRSMLLVLATLSFASCASVPAPATNAPDNPASAAAEEGRSQKLELFAAADAPPSPAIGTAVSDPATDIYTCVMHPHIAEPKPGKCPICGMPLVKRPKEKK